MSVARFWANPQELQQSFGSLVTYSAVRIRRVPLRWRVGAVTRRGPWRVPTPDSETEANDTLRPVRFRSARISALRNNFV